MWWQVCEALPQGQLAEVRGRGTAAAASLLTFFLNANANGGAQPSVEGKKLPLLTRLAGGVRAWRGERRLPDVAGQNRNNETGRPDPSTAARDVPEGFDMGELVKALREQELEDLTLMPPQDDPSRCDTDNADESVDKLTAVGGISATEEATSATQIVM